MAGQRQAVVVHGDKANKTVATSAVDGDKAVISFADGSAQTVDRAAFAVYNSNHNTTAINTTTVDKKTNGQCHTIDGMKVYKPTRQGIYIKDGKKMVMGRKQK